MGISFFCQLLLQLSCFAGILPTSMTDMSDCKFNPPIFNVLFSTLLYCRAQGNFFRLQRRRVAAPAPQNIPPVNEQNQAENQVCLLQCAQFVSQNAVNYERRNGVDKTCYLILHFHSAFQCVFGVKYCKFTICISICMNSPAISMPPFPTFHHIHDRVISTHMPVMTSNRLGCV